MNDARKKAGSESMMRPSIMTVSYEEARTRKILAEAEIAELELSRIVGTLCKTDDVVKAWELVLHACKSRLLSLPSKVAPIVAVESDSSIIKTTIEAEIREALNELANYQPTIDPINSGSFNEQSSESDEAANSAAETKRSRVGRSRKKAG